MRVEIVDHGPGIALRKGIDAFEIFDIIVMKFEKVLAAQQFLIVDVHAHPEWGCKVERR